jgi:hypothetical protein
MVKVNLLVLETVQSSRALQVVKVSLLISEIAESQEPSPHIYMQSSEQILKPGIWG